MEKMALDDDGYLWGLSVVHANQLDVIIRMSQFRIQRKLTEGSNIKLKPTLPHPILMLNFPL